MRKISFTGSTAVGKQLMKQAADQMKRLSLELGGHAPFIVFPDADPEVVAKAAVVGKFRNNGQVCISPSRFFVHKDIEKKFTEVAVEEAKKLKMGNGLEEGVVVGPMFEKKAMDNTQALIDDAKGKGAQGPHRRQEVEAFSKGYFFEPTVLEGLSPDAKMLTEEPFAPVMPVLDFTKIDDVIARRTTRKYGLAAYVFTNDITVDVADGRGAGGGHHRRERSGARDAAMPVRRHEGIRPGPRTGPRRAGSLPGNEVRLDGITILTGNMGRGGELPFSFNSATSALHENFTTQLGLSVVKMGDGLSEYPREAARPRDLSGKGSLP